MHKRRYAFLSAAVFCSLFCPFARASVVGTSVTGSLTFTGDPSNYFDPGYGFVPSSGYLNASGKTVAISSGATEFGFDDGASLISADFSASALALSDLIELSSTAGSYELTFMDAAFVGQSFSFSSGSTIPSKISLVGSTLTLDYAGQSVTTGQRFTSTLNIAPAAVPEPSTMTLSATSLMIGAVAFAVSRRKRFEEPLTV